MRLDVAISQATHFAKSYVVKQPSLIRRLKKKNWPHFHLCKVSNPCLSWTKTHIYVAILSVIENNPYLFGWKILHLILIFAKFQTLVSLSTKTHIYDAILRVIELIYQSCFVTLFGIIIQEGFQQSKIILAQSWTSSLIFKCVPMCRLAWEIFAKKSLCKKQPLFFRRLKNLSSVPMWRLVREIFAKKSLCKNQPSFILWLTNLWLQFNL